MEDVCSRSRKKRASGTYQGNSELDRGISWGTNDQNQKLRFTDRLGGLVRTVFVGAWGLDKRGKGDYLKSTHKDGSAPMAPKRSKQKTR